MKIIELKLFTSDIAKQFDFYSQILGLEPKERTNKSISFQVGHSILKFEHKEKCTPYHYAINIPSNQAKEALRWLKDRVEILNSNNTELHFFDFWNAYAVYFYDEDKNIVELIARKELKNNSTKVFGQNTLLGISEIGLPTFNIEQEFNILNKNAKMPIHSGTFDRFCSVGDDNGLFILLNKKNKKYWFPTQDKPQSSDFEIKIKTADIIHEFHYNNALLTQV